jgi:hypothetical protein
MKRIFFVCVEGFAKAKMDGDGFFGTRILIIWEILGFVFEVVLALELVYGILMTEAEVLEAVVVGTRMKRVRLAER